MDFIFTFALVSLVVLIACLIAYAHNTNSIIRIQEKQIARLRTENFRLQAALSNRRNGTARVQVVEIHDNRIDEQNIPEFGNI